MFVIKGGGKVKRSAKLIVFLLGSDARLELVCPRRTVGGERLYGNILSRTLYPCFFNVF